MFETLEQATSLFAQPQGAGAGQQPAAPNILAAVIRMLQAQPGGIHGVVQRFEQAGLASVVQSWLASGANQPISAPQVEQALGSAPIDQVARDLGVGHADAASHISQFLPLILDHLSPNERPPPGNGFSELTGLLSRFAA